MKISVALASYNGEKYIKEQLESILNQSVQVDEIVVSDDGSKDSTVEIVRAFNDSRIVLLQDNVNHGYTGNFEHALKHTTGDIILLSDQDDVWMPNKVERHLSVFESNPGVGLVIASGTIIDENGNDITNKQTELSLNPQLRISQSCIIPRKEFLSTAALYCLANGMCMSLARSFLETSLPFPYSSIGHDVWIGFNALNTSTVFYLCENLVKYRLHSFNASKWSNNVSFIQRFKRSLIRTYNEPYSFFNLSICSLAHLDNSSQDDESAIRACKSKKEISYKQIKALESNFFSGIINLIKLKLFDAKYKETGRNYFIAQVLFLLLRRFLFSKKQLSNKCLTPNDLIS